MEQLTTLTVIDFAFIPVLLKMNYRKLSALG